MGILHNGEIDAGCRDEEGLVVKPFVGEENDCTRIRRSHCASSRGNTKDLA